MSISKLTITSLLLLVLLSWYAFWIIAPINLATADLGRHIKNGELITTKWSEYGPAVLSTNFYSYTYPNQPFVNHHWGTGVIFYLLFIKWGMVGIQIFFTTVSLLTLLIFLDLARRNGGMARTALIAIPIIPLIASRGEVRPELFSYLFIGIFFWILWQYQKGAASRYWLWILPALELIWVNLHIYFIFGVILVFLFALPTLGRILWLGADGWEKYGRRFKNQGVTLVLTLFVTLINPHAFRGIWHLTSLFKNYGYTIVENQSVHFLENWGMKNPNFMILKILLSLMLISFIITFLRRRKSSLAVFFTSAMFGLMAWFALRNFTILGLVSIPVLSANLKNIPGLAIPRKTPNRGLIYIVIMLTLSAATYFYYFDEARIQHSAFKLGLLPGINAASDFIKDHNIQGPIFNNYDIGSYLIYHFSPDRRVFVDNRPEAYPADFFKKVYIPMQEDEKIWQQQLDKYDFNMIVYWRHDLTNWAQTFLVRIVKDRQWVPVFIDQYNIILIRDRPENQAIIDQFAIPRSVFTTSNRT